MRLSKYDQKWLRGMKRAADLKGEGIFIYENNTSGDLMLPRATKSGVKNIKKKEQFQGDDYYMFMVRNNELRLIEVIQAAVKQEATTTTQTLCESNTGIIMEKLITEQPPVVTNEGTVEYRLPKQKQQKLNENKPGQQTKQNDVLLNENPLDGVEII